MKHILLSVQLFYDIVSVFQKLFVASKFCLTVFEIYLHFLVHIFEALSLLSISRNVEFDYFEVKNNQILTVIGFIKFIFLAFNSMSYNRRSYSDFSMHSVYQSANIDGNLVFITSSTGPELINILKSMFEIALNFSCKFGGLVSNFDVIILIKLRFTLLALPSSKLKTLSDKYYCIILL